ncbi:S8 family serine peptidase [Ornithinimicrobium cerasi]|uniref:S8 family serine peptidase n=1 Tax=Ornithinimicrobium cerasi TaxID=2248773 RepID=UPI000EFF4DC5|nr:S8 family serine peptidase [Ornithinimicrobium cerasi]
MADDDDMLVLDLPPEVLRRHGARVLDPVTAPRDPAAEEEGGPRSPGTTTYLTSTLLLRGLPGRSAGRTLERLRGTAENAGYAVELTVEETDLAFEEWLGDERAEEVDRVYQTRVRIVPTSAAAPLDAWELLAAARAEGPVDADLEHLMLAAGGGYYWGGQGGGYYWGGQGGGYYWGGQGQDDGEVGARTPVTLGLADLGGETRAPERSPVVVVPDTGIGAHPWLTGDLTAVLRDLDGIPVGPPGGLDPDPEDKGVRNDLTGVLDRLSGHGTFIAGIVRQAASDARLVGLPVLDSSGAVAEGDVHRTLTALWVLHARAQDAGFTGFEPKDLSRGFVLDVLNISMGYYHQDGVVEAHPLRDLLRLLGERGVLVVTAAGNDATRVPLYPAGWAAGATPPEDRSVVPLVAVGATNPDGETVALFSNAGPWVTTHAPGVNVVSTLPTSFQASANPSRSTPGDGGALRARTDRDDMRRGFAVWSGTSFAAPDVAGRVADRLAEATVEGGASVDPKVMLERAWAALDQEVWR